MKLRCRHVRISPAQLELPRGGTREKGARMVRTPSRNDLERNSTQGIVSSATATELAGLKDDPTTKTNAQLSNSNSRLCLVLVPDSLEAVSKPPVSQRFIQCVRSISPNPTHLALSLPNQSYATTN